MKSSTLFERGPLPEVLNDAQNWEGPTPHYAQLLTLLLQVASTLRG